MEEIVEVVQVVLHERLQQRTVEQKVNAPAPLVVDATSERERKRTDEQFVHTPIPLTPPTWGNGAQQGVTRNHELPLCHSKSRAK